MELLIQNLRFRSVKDPLEHGEPLDERSHILIDPFIGELMDFWIRVTVHFALFSTDSTIDPIGLI